MKLLWFVPTHGDSRYLGSAVGACAASFDYFRQIAVAADSLGYEGVLIPTGRSCEDPWIVAASLIEVTRRLKCQPPPLRLRRSPSRGRPERPGGAGSAAAAGLGQRLGHIASKAFAMHTAELEVTEFWTAPRASAQDTVNDAPMLGEAAPTRAPGLALKLAGVGKSFGTPKLLLRDEPLGALDVLTRIEMQRLIERPWLRHGFTALLVTHDVGEAVALADRVLLIEDGRLALDEPVPLARPRSRGDARYAALEERILSRVLQLPEAAPAVRVEVG